MFFLRIFYVLFLNLTKIKALSGLII